MPVDNCSFWFEGNWSQCCYIHDLDYANLDIAKFLADIDLYKCVVESGHPLMALVILVGVLLFGLPFWLLARKKSNGRRS